MALGNHTAVPLCVCAGKGKETRSPGWQVGHCDEKREIETERKREREKEKERESTGEKLRELYEIFVM